MGGVGRQKNRRSLGRGVETDIEILRDIKQTERERKRERERERERERADFTTDRQRQRVTQ